MVRLRPSIAVVGSSNLDLVASVARAPDAGETVVATGFERGFGGKGANQAVMAARFDADVAFIGAVGDDPFGALLVRNLLDSGVATDAVDVIPGPSGTAQIWVEPDGTNRIVVVAGANGAVDPGAAASAVEKLASLHVVIGQLEIPQVATAAAFAAGKARGAITILNPAPAAALEPGLLSVSDWLIPNEVELERLGGGASADEDSVVVAFARRLGRPIVVTLGSAGAVLVDTDAVVRVPAPRAAAMDSTGAGDAFVGAFAYGLGAGLTPIDAVRLGVACASDSVMRAGAQASYPDRVRTAGLLAQAISQPLAPGMKASSSG